MAWAVSCLGSHILGSDVLAVMGAPASTAADRSEPQPQFVEPRCQSNLAPFW